MIHRRCAGFTVVELLIVVAVIAIILGIVLPNYSNIHQDGLQNQVENELETLKVAVLSYWRHNGTTFPPNITSALTTASPVVITQITTDPWKTDVASNTYGYATGSDAAFGDYFVIYSKGPKGDTSPQWDSDNKKVVYTGTGKVVSNAPVEQQ